MSAMYRRPADSIMAEVLPALDLHDSRPELHFGGREREGDFPRFFGGPDLSRRIRFTISTFCCDITFSGGRRRREPPPCRGKGPTRSSGRGANVQIWADRLSMEGAAPFPRPCSWTATTTLDPASINSSASSWYSSEVPR